MNPLEQPPFYCGIRQPRCPQLLIPHVVFRLAIFVVQGEQQLVARR